MTLRTDQRIKGNACLRGAFGLRAMRTTPAPAAQVILAGTKREGPWYQKGIFSGLTGWWRRETTSTLFSSPVPEKQTYFDVQSWPLRHSPSPAAPGTVQLNHYPSLSLIPKAMTIPQP